MVNLFSVGALFIMYREALEAAVVIGVMISIMERLGFKKLKKQGMYTDPPAQILSRPAGPFLP